MSLSRRRSGGLSAFAVLALTGFLAAAPIGETQSLPPWSGLDPRTGVCVAPGGFTIVAGAGALTILDATGTAVARASLPPGGLARVAATEEPGAPAAGAGSSTTSDLLIAVVQGRPATVFDRFRFRGPWRSAPALVGGTTAVYHFVPATAALAKLWDGPGPDLNPWWVGFGDFTGTSQPSLMVGVWKTAVFDPLYDRRPFVYGLYPSAPSAVPAGSDPAGAGGVGFQPHPQWLGSRLSNPLVELAAGDADGDGSDEIVAVTVERDGSFAVSTYDWSGFGFVLGARTTGFRQVAAVAVLSPGRLAVVGRRTTGGDRLFTFENSAGALIPSGSAPLPVNWNHPGAVSVQTLGDGIAVEVSADGRTALMTAPGR